MGGEAGARRPGVADPEDVRSRPGRPGRDQPRRGRARLPHAAPHRRGRPAGPRRGLDALLAERRLPRAARRDRREAPEGQRHPGRSRHADLRDRRRDGGADADLPRRPRSRRRGAGHRPLLLQLRLPARAGRGPPRLRPDRPGARLPAVTRGPGRGDHPADARDAPQQPGQSHRRRVPARPLARRG